MGVTEGEPQRPIAVGKVTRAHGVRGEVSVLVLSEVSDRFSPGAGVRVEQGDELVVERSRPHGARLLVKFRGIDDRGRAEGLAGRYLLVSASEVPDAPEGSFWPHELEGCEVVTERGRRLGRIKEVMPAPGADLWSAVDDDREWLIPALRDVVERVDLAARRVVVREVPGLTTEEPEG